MSLSSTKVISIGRVSIIASICSIDKLCRRLQQANLQIKHLVKRDEKSLIAMNLLYIFSEIGDKTDIDLNKTMREICLSLELSHNEVLNRLEEFESNDILSIAGNRICLINKDKLMKMSDQDYSS